MNSKGGIEKIKRKKGKNDRTKEGRKERKGKETRNQGRK